jgi:PAS domain S-box-containing protein
MNQEPSTHPAAAGPSPAPVAIAGGAVSDRLFRLLVDAVTDYAIFLLDPAGCIASWNRGAERLKGYRADEIVGRHFSILHTEEDRRRGVPARALRLAAEQGVHQLHGWRVRRDGSCFWAHVVITPIRDGGGRLIGFAKITQDLTRERRAQRELRESEERYRLLADMIPQHVWTTDADGRLNYLSRRWYDYTGTAPGEAEGGGWLRLLHPDDRARTLARWRHSLRTGEPYAIEYRFRGARGGYCWFLGQAVPLRDDSGDVVRWFGTLTDISGRKELEDQREQLLARERRSREQVTRILESITDAFVAVDREWRFTYVNRRGREVIRALAPAATGELIGRDLWDTLPELRGTGFERVHRRAMAEHRPMHLESYLAAWDRWFEVHDYPSSDGLAVYFRDVTERKLAEREREELLERERQARAEAQARREELERITESRTRLMRGFTHDVKNPLGAADGYAQLMEAGLLGELSEKQRHSLGRIRRSIHSSLRLIEDLLELARTEAGQIEIEAVDTDLAQLAREAAEDFRAQASAAGLALEVRADGPLCARTDPARVRQIVGNLLSNAVKYTPDGQITVETAWRADEEGAASGRVEIRVTDTGPGIPPAKREAIFQEFTRLDPAAEHGAGVGLAISRRIARLLGGDLGVESEEGRGSTFFFVVPAGAADETGASG